jgi:rubredoxin-NAD+ reductase
MPYVMPIMHAARAIAQTLAGNATALQFPAMPISVKTPAWPVVIEPVAGGVEGQWVVESQSDTGLKMIFTETGGALRGFVLAGDLVKERMVMTKLVSVKTAVPV